MAAQGKSEELVSFVESKLTGGELMNKQTQEEKVEEAVLEQPYPVKQFKGER